MLIPCLCVRNRVIVDWSKYKLGGGEDDVVIGGTQQVFKNVQIYVRTQHS